MLGQWTEGEWFILSCQWIVFEIVVFDEFLKYKQLQLFQILNYFGFTNSETNKTYNPIIVHQLHLQKLILTWL